MDTITIRHATPEDLETLLRFEQEVIKAERPMDPTIRPAPVHYYDLETLIRDAEAAVMVAEADGRLVGSGYACVKPARKYLDHKFYAYLGFMYTVPEYRGKGVNKCIIDKLKDWASSRGLSEIRLTVYEDNLPAIKAYEKVGFRRHIIEMRIAGSEE